jgi:superfamily II DNA or RNA helicase
MAVRISFDRGTLDLEDLGDTGDVVLPGVLWDPRSRSTRAPAYRFGEIVNALASAGIEAEHASTWPEPKGQFVELELRPYQQAALDCWEVAGHRGVVVLPTGAGKTRVALAALARVRASTLCLVPTRALLHQWHGELQRAYSGGVGALGDGSRSLRPITVSTYESAYRYMHRFGDRFRLLIVDEAHHFGSGQRDETLEMSVAPMRLGLTATPLCDDGREASERLIGPEVYRLGVLDLSGRYLAEMEHVRMELELSRAERYRYELEQDAYRDAYRAFMRAHPEAAWSDFARAANASERGRQALAAFRRARAIAHYTRAKSEMVGRLLHRHRQGRCLVFTAGNDASYALAREHLVMPITCDIGHKERERAFELFRGGQLRALVSSRVLNEGIDLPDADVAIIVGGSHGEREHVQRIGRVLRPAEGKRALIYELVSRGTTEITRALNRNKALGHAQAG